MNETQELEVVDLGDAKELTTGPFGPVFDEDHPVLPYRIE
jgi:hypothetical protein